MSYTARRVRRADPSSYPTISHYVLLLNKNPLLSPAICFLFFLFSLLSLQLSCPLLLLNILLPLHRRRRYFRYLPRRLALAREPLGNLSKNLFLSSLANLLANIVLVNLPSGQQVPNPKRTLPYGPPKHHPIPRPSLQPPQRPRSPCVATPFPPLRRTLLHGVRRSPLFPSTVSLSIAHDPSCRKRCPPFLP